MTPEHLSRLSTLLDEALELDDAARVAWLDALPSDSAELAPALRAMLAKAATKETADLLERGPSFTAPGDADITSTAFHPGDAVGPYRLLRSLGHGGMGEVWQAERADGTVRRKVALKLPYVTWAPGLPERFARERQILASLEHPHIARLYDAGFDPQGRPYMALEYVEGHPIDEFSKRHALPIAARLGLLLQVADAVAFAHGRLVLHRDLKPANILVTAEGDVRLLDFGVAKLMQGDQAAETALTRVSGRALTLDYASPEQVRGEPLGTASDVYSLGVVAFELLTGRRPYRLQRGSAGELEEAITAQDIPVASSAAEAPAERSALRGDLDAILNKALKKAPTERYATIDALAQDIRRHLEGLRVLARPDSLSYRALRLLRRYRMPLAAAAVVVTTFGLLIGVSATAVVILALLLGLGGALWQAHLARSERDRARAEQVRADQIRVFLSELLSETEPSPGRAIAPAGALDMLDRGVERVGRDHARHPRMQADILVDLARVYQRLSETARSVKPLQRAIALLEAEGRPDDPVLHAARAYLANDFLIRGDEQSARSAWHRVLTECTGDDKQSWYARAYAHYSLSWDPDLDPRVARRHVELALAAYDRCYGSVHSEYSLPLERLAQLAVEADDVAAAESALARVDELARSIALKSLDLERVDTVRASVESARGRRGAAHERLRKLLATPNEARPDYLISGALIQQSGLSSALGLPERALAEAREGFAAAPGQAPSRRHLKSRMAEALALSLLRRHAEARAALDDAMGQARTMRLADNNATMLAIRGLGLRMLVRAGDLPPAESALRDLLPDIESTLGHGHAEHLAALHLKAVLALARADFGTAIRMADEVSDVAAARRDPMRPFALRASLVRALASPRSEGSAEKIRIVAARLEDLLDPEAPLRHAVRKLADARSAADETDVLLALQ